MNGRVYDPRLGRFLSPDPIVGDPTSSQSWNLYSYVGNNPLSYVDPTGLDPWDGCGWLCPDDIDAWWDWLNFLNSWWDIPYAAGDSYDSAGDSLDGTTTSISSACGKDAQGHGPVRSPMSRRIQGRSLSK